MKFQEVQRRFPAVRRMFDNDNLLYVTLYRLTGGASVGRGGSGSRTDYTADDVRGLVLRRLLTLNLNQPSIGAASLATAHWSQRQVFIYVNDLCTIVLDVPGDVWNDLVRGGALEADPEGELVEFRPAR